MVQRFASQVSWCVTPPFVYVHSIVWYTNETSSRGGSVDEAGTIVSGDHRRWLEMRPFVILMVKNCSVVPSPVGFGRKNLNVPSMTAFSTSALEISGVALSI